MKIIWVTAGLQHLCGDVTRLKESCPHHWKSSSSFTLKQTLRAPLILFHSRPLWCTAHSLCIYTHWVSVRLIDVHDRLSTSHDLFPSLYSWCMLLLGVIISACSHFNNFCSQCFHVLLLIFFLHLLCNWIFLLTAWFWCLLC